MIRIPAIKNAVQVASAMASKQIGPAAASALIGLKVDGHPVQVKEGATLLDAINKSGSHVPTLCYHPEFEPKAVCECIMGYLLHIYVYSREVIILFFHRMYIGRMCLVDVKGEKLLPACRTKAKEGHDILTNTEELKAFRRR